MKKQRKASVRDLAIASQQLHARATAAESRVAELTGELERAREAVRVLGQRVHSCEHMLACYRVGRRPSDIALDAARESSDAVDANPIASALRDAAKVQEGHVRLPDGREVRVLGELPRLADGTIYTSTMKDTEFEPAPNLWCVHPNDGEITEMAPFAFWSELEDWRVSAATPDDQGDRVCRPLAWCHLTRAAAEAAKEDR